MDEDRHDLNSSARDDQQPEEGIFQIDKKNKVVEEVRISDVMRNITKATLQIDKIKPRSTQDHNNTTKEMEPVLTQGASNAKLFGESDPIMED